MDLTDDKDDEDAEDEDRVEWNNSVPFDDLQTLSIEELKSSAPVDGELEEIWSVRTAKVSKATVAKPIKASIKDRMKRIHRLRREHAMASRAYRCKWNGPIPWTIDCTIRLRCLPRRSFPIRTRCRTLLAWDWKRLKCGG
jgi:hypothetical protein